MVQPSILDISGKYYIQVRMYIYKHDRMLLEGRKLSQCKCTRYSHTYSILFKSIIRLFPKGKTSTYETGITDHEIEGGKSVEKKRNITT